MPTLDDIQSNELAIVVRHQGEVSVWKGWKRATCAFHDPQMWRDTSKYDQYFERLDNNDWGMAGYGVIVMDLDNKTTWSFNDYSAPWLLNLPNPTHHDSNPAEQKAFMALLSEPAQWPHVVFDVHQRRLLTVDLKEQKISLDELLPAGVSADKAFELLSSRDGEISHGKDRYMVFHGRYLPPGWTVGCEIGQDGPDGLLKALQAWEATGFPAPSDWEGIDSAMSEFDWPLTDDEFTAYAEEIEELEGDDDVDLQDDMKAGYAAAQEYRALRERWSNTTTAQVARPKGP